MPKQPKKTWVYSPPRPAKPTLPEALKAEVTARANELIETTLKPRHVQPPPENPQFNYVEDLYTKWYRGYFYFCATYRVAGPHAMVPTFESHFARLEYVGDNRFNLAFKRYTGEWIDLPYRGITLDKALAEIPVQGYFIP